MSPLRAVLRRHGVQVGLAFVLLLASVAASLTVPLTVRNLVQDLGQHRSAASDALALVVLALVAALAAAWGSFVLGRIGELTVLETRGRLMRHVLRMPVLDVRRIGAGTSPTGSPPTPRSCAPCSTWASPRCPPRRSRPS